MTVSLRLPYSQIESDEQFGRLVEYLHIHRATFDEICMFTDANNVTCPSLDIFARQCRLIARRILQLREADFGRVGINFLNTLGHVEEVIERMPLESVPQMVDWDGRLAKNSPCPNDPVARDYLAAKYRLAAKAHPDFLWVDDDFRMHMHGVNYPCFCPVCIKKFGHGFNSREELVSALNESSNAELRRQWVEFNENTLAGLADLIRLAVQGVDPDIELGLMTIGPLWAGYSGFSFDKWFSALDSSIARPGGGFYNDSKPDDMIVKALDIGRQCSLFPDRVTDIQYELENFPCLRLQKSVQTVINECSLALASGCNGVALSILHSAKGRLNDCDDLTEEICRYRGVWQELVQKIDKSPMVGVWPAWHPEFFSRKGIENGSWFACSEKNDVDPTLPLSTLGLPICADRKYSCVTAMPGHTVDYFTDNELREILAGGVITDAQALGKLWKRGMGELAGVKPGMSFTQGAFERLTNHPFNGAFAGDERYVSLGFYQHVAWELASVGDGVQALSMLVLDSGEEAGLCATCYENGIGGRVVVFGIWPWSWLGTSAKRTQLIAAADWASRNTLPIVIDRTVRVVPFVHMNEARNEVAAVLLNTSYDATGLLRVRLRGDFESIHMLLPDGNQELSLQKHGNESVIEVPELMPWKAVMLCS